MTLDRINEMKISIIIPAYNSRRLLPHLIQKIRKVNFKKLRTEIIVVDDCSPDKTYEVVKKEKDIILIRHQKNMGKGAAMRTGFKKATGDILYMLDDDLEYHPGDIPKVIKPILDHQADVTFSSRHLNPRNKYSSLFYRFGGHLIDSLINLYLGIHLSDSLSGPKAFSRYAYNQIRPIKSTGFELESELVAKTVKKKLRYTEVPVRYFPRTHKQGKNIHWYHGFRILAALPRYK